MTNYVCKSCGYSTQEENAKFCQKCGSELVKENVCPNCNAPIAAGAKFCSACGTAIELGQVTPSTPAAQPIAQPQMAATGVYRDVNGPMLKAMPIAHYLDKGAKIIGAIKLCRDGLRFAALNGERINCPLEMVASVNRGAKTDILEVQMKDGKMFSFQVMGGKKWLEVFNNLLH